MRRQLDNLAILVRREPNKAAVLAFLAITLAVFWINSRREGPTPAAAEPISAEQPGATWRSAPDIGRSAELLNRWTAQPLGHVSRNLFTSELTVPPAGPGTAPKAESRDEDGMFWRQLERALASRSDRDQYRRSLGEAAVRDASKLTVTSIVYGPDCSALLGEKMVRLGGLVLVEGDAGPFTVVAIEPARVVLARDGHRVALKLGKSGATLDDQENSAAE